MTQNELNDVVRGLMQEELEIAAKLEMLNSEDVDRDELQHAREHFQQAYEALKLALQGGKPPESVPPPVEPEEPVEPPPPPPPSDMTLDAPAEENRPF
jgi:hypothetical protein